MELLLLLPSVVGLYRRHFPEEENVEGIRRTYALMAATIPAWQCFIWLQYSQMGFVSLIMIV